MAVLTAICASAMAELTLSENDGLLLVGHDGNSLLGYQFGTMAAPAGVDPVFERSGFIHPLVTPGGKVLTRIHPPDHYHHYGIWNPWTQIEFDGAIYDLWNLVGRQGTVRFAGFESRTVEETYVEFVARHEHVACVDPETPVVIMNERQTVRVYSLEDDDRYSWDLVIDLEAATDKSVTLLEHRYGGFGWRATGEWRRGNSEVLASEGQDRSNVDNTPGRWFLIQGEVGGAYAGALVMSHPGNFNHPEPMRIWPPDYQGDGQVFASFAPTKNTDWVIEPGQTYRRVYRFLVYDGKLSAEEADTAWQSFAGRSE